MYQNSKVSIITSIYNSEKFIGDAINSVLNQTYKDWEMILVDDNSSDSSEDIIKELTKGDSRFIYVRINDNAKGVKARNTAMKMISGRYVAFLNSNNLWKKDKLKKQIEFMNKNDYGFTFTSCEMIDEEGNDLDKVIRAPFQVDYNYLLKNTIIGPSTVVIDRNIVGDFEMVDIEKEQDYATWLSILRKGHKAHGLYFNLVSHRKVDSSSSSDKLKKIWSVYREIEKLPLMKSTYCFCWNAFNSIKKHR